MKPQSQQSEKNYVYITNVNIQKYITPLYVLIGKKDICHFYYIVSIEKSSLTFLNDTCNLSKFGSTRNLHPCIIQRTHFAFFYFPEAFYTSNSYKFSYRSFLLSFLFLLIFIHSTYYLFLYTFLVTQIIGSYVLLIKSIVRCKTFLRFDFIVLYIIVRRRKN